MRIAALASGLFQSPGCKTVPIGVAKQADNCYVLRDTGFSAFGTTTFGTLLGWHPCGAGLLACAFLEIAADAPVSASGGNHAKSMVVTIYGGDEQAHHEQR